jgi:hypothetical protein
MPAIALMLNEQLNAADGSPTTSAILISRGVTNHLGRRTASRSDSAASCQVAITLHPGWMASLLKPRLRR